jgi:c-di-AMP phosphodiesterase-like protein
MEGADVIIDILVTIIVCGIIAFIIGFILGFIFGPVVYGICGTLDIIFTIVAFVLTIIISLRTTAQLSAEFEETLVSVLVDNYIGVIESQDLLIQILGLI